MRYDKVPFIMGLLTGVTPDLVVPGPNKTEWSAAVFTVLALVVRELAWWLRNRKGKRDA